MTDGQRRWAWRIGRDVVAFGAGVAIGLWQAFVVAEPNAAVLVFAGGMVATGVAAKVEESKRDQRERDRDRQVD